jgi:tetratricopeptide (TPR) repeat protein
MSVSDWDGAITVLERFRQRYPDSRWQAEATRKLALAYLESGRLPLAADEFARIGRETADTAVARDAAWRSAELYARTGDITRTIGALEGYVTRFPQPMDRAMEARWRLAETQRTLGDDSRRQYWLREIVDADERAGAARTDFSRETAAKAALALADPLRETFARAQVKIPLDKSLKAKKQAMEKAIGALRKAAGYGVGSVTTAATFRIAELYHDFGRALLESQRPPGLSAEEREQYDVLLEEQAYPFEEESIKLHEINFKRIAQGFYDEWVRASMDQLAVLVPARYGKSEKEVPYVDSLW